MDHQLEYGMTDGYLSGLLQGSISSPYTASRGQVSELVDADTHWWNFPLIHEVFTPDEASR
jgi:hypothetical protein